MKHAKEWSKAHEPQLDRLMQGAAVLLSSTVVRSTVNMALSMSKPRQPHGVFGSEADAVAFARDRCSEVRVWTKKPKKRKL